MCGRFTNRFTWRELVELYRITEPYIAPISNLQPRYKFAPMQRGPVVRLDKEGRREPMMMRWGLVPSWAKDDSTAAWEGWLGTVDEWKALLWSLPGELGPWAV